MAQFNAQLDRSLEAKVIGSMDMVYSDSASSGDDRPPHVLAASGLSVFKEYLAVVQDDANWLALIDGNQRVTSVPLPPGPGGQRVFTKSRGNQDHKCDFEACVALPGRSGLELIGFSSGSKLQREWILRVQECPDGGDGTNSASHSNGPGLAPTLIHAHAFFEFLSNQTEFCGAGLNIEGAIALDDERIMLFQRGNAEPRGSLLPVDATAELSWRELQAYLDDPERAQPPPLRRIRTYELGELDGIRLTFSDAEHLGHGRVLYSASAEDEETGKVAGSVLGVIEPDGTACWTELLDVDGSGFTGKIEGLTRDVTDPHLIHFVIDDDDDEVPSKVFQARINSRFCEAPPR